MYIITIIITTPTPLPRNFSLTSTSARCLTRLIIYNRHNFCFESNEVLSLQPPSSLPPPPPPSPFPHSPINLVLPAPLQGSQTRLTMDTTVSNIIQQQTKLLPWERPGIVSAPPPRNLSLTSTSARWLNKANNIQRTQLLF